MISLINGENFFKLKKFYETKNRNKEYKPHKIITNFINKENKINELLYKKSLINMLGTKRKTFFKKYYDIKNNYNNKFVKELLKYLIILCISISSISNEKIIFYSSDNIIILKIKITQKSGYNILNSNWYNKLNHHLDEVYLNGIFQDNYRYQNQFNIYLNETENNITLVWKKNLDTTDNMFYGCVHVNEIDLSNFNTSEITDMSNMFRSCFSLTYINLTNFDTSKIIDMKSMFEGCSSLEHLDLSYFDTSNVLNMSSMFLGCSKLYSVNLSNFDTSKVQNMSKMFYECYNLISLNISKFDTMKVTNMSYMFYSCSKLEYLDLSNFNTLNVNDMKYMFANCSNLISLDLSHFFTSNVLNMNYMFYLCKKLAFLNLTNFDTSKVTTMYRIFSDCIGLTSLDLSYFNTSNVVNMDYFFNNCKLTSLDLSRFDTSKVTTMQYIFQSCTELISLNLSNFDISKVTGMHNMFNNCKNLKFLDISNFNVSSSAIINNIFDSTPSLKIINLENFRTVIKVNFLRIFNNTIKNNEKSFICVGPDNIILNQKIIYISCMNNLDKIKEYKCYIKSTNDLKNNQYICIICGNNFYKKNNDLLNNNSYINCYQNPDGYYLDTNITNKNETKYEQCYSSCKLCDREGNNKFHNCIECDNNYTFKYNISNYYNCYKCSYYYFINFTSDEIFCTENMRCPESYNKLIIDKNECINNCSTDLIYKYEYNNICYDEYNYNKVINLINSTNSEFMSDEINISDTIYDIYSTTESVINEISSINATYDLYSSDLTSNEIIINDTVYTTFYTESITTEINIKEATTLSSTFSTEVIFDETNINDNPMPASDAYNTENTYNEINIVTNTIISESYSTEVNSIEMNINNYNNYTEFTYYEMIRIGESSDIINEPIETYENSIFKYTDSFEIYNDTIHNESQYENIINNLLNNYNQISDKNSLIINLKNINALFSLSSTEYHKNNLNENKTSINLGECEDKLKSFYHIKNESMLLILLLEKNEEGMKIPKIEYEVYYASNSGNLSKLNLTVCTGMKADVYIPVKINDDIEKYNSSSDYYNDVCSKTTSEFGTDISLTDRKNNFINNNMTLCEEECELVEYNFTTAKAKCSCNIKLNIPFINKIKFDKKKLLKSFIDLNNIVNIKFLKCFKTVFILINLKNNYGFYIYVLILIIYFISLFIFYGKLYSFLIKKISLIFDSKNKLGEFKQKYEKYLPTEDDNKNRILKIKKRNKFFTSYPRGKIKKNINISFENERIDDINETPANSKNKFQIDDLKIITKKENYVKYKSVLTNNDNELNSFSYKEALKEDKRTYIQYYLSLLKENHLLIFSFYSHEKDYNSQIIKIFLFFFFFGLHVIINALFFDDDTMHEIYIDKGSFNFIYQLSQIIYSSIISAIITIFIKYLALTESIILEIKNEKNIKSLNTKITKIKKIIKIKFIIFFIVSFLLLLFFSYYISCFCGIYVNTQMHLIKDSVISFGLGLVYPFGLFLIPGIFRIPALKAKKKDQEYLYKFSKLIQDLVS